MTDEERISKFTPLVRSLVTKVCLRVRLPGCLTQDDLVAVGLVGLWKAARNFDPGRGTSFKGWAYTRIWGEIFDEIRRFGRVSRVRYARLRDLYAAQEILRGRLGRTPTTGELAKAAGESVEWILESTTLDQRFKVVSLDQPTETDTRVGHLVRGPDPDPADVAELRDEVDHVLSKISDPRDRELIVLRYLEGLTFARIGEALGVSESRVHQLHSRLMTKLKKALR